MENNKLTKCIKTKRNNGEGALRQLKNGNWEGAEKIFRKNGTYIRKSVTRNDRKEVILLKNRLKALEPLDNDVIDIVVEKHTNVIKLKKGEITPTGEKKEYIDKDISVNEYVDYWLWEHRRKGIKKRRIVNNTFADYVQKCTYIKRYLGTKLDNNNNRILIKLNELTYDMIENALIKLEKDLCITTARQIKNHIIHMLNCATKIDKILSYNPLEDREINLIETKKKKEKQIISESDEKKVILECINLNYYDLLVALFTGARASEISGLTWDNINFEDNTITIEKEFMQIKKYDYVDGKIILLGRECEVTELKTKSSYRVLGIPEEITDILKKHKEKQKKLAKQLNKQFKETDFVFTSSNYRTYDKTDIHTHMSILMKKLKIKNWKELSPHCLRHTYCSTGVRNNVSLADMKALLGHENISVTADWYTHFDKEQIIKSSKEVNKNRLYILNSINS